MHEAPALISSTQKTVGDAGYSGTGNKLMDMGCRREDLSLDPQHSHKEPGMAVHTCEPSTGDSETVGSWPASSSGDPVSKLR